MQGPSDEAMHAYYERDQEAARLASGVGRLEFERTLELLQRELPDAPARVADIGGGPGRYTDWLVGAGYQVAHRDPVPLHVEHVRGRHPELDTAVGDARQLDLADESVDAVLLLGPLYHLPEAADRAKALSEAGRVVRPGGVVFAAAISRWAPRLDGLVMNRVYRELPALPDMVADVEATGLLPPVEESAFNGYTHRPDELAAEVVAAGLELVGVATIEGVGAFLSDLDERLDDEVDRRVLLDALAATESVSELVGLGPHLLATARKPAA